MNDHKVEKFWNKLAGTFDKRAQNFELPPITQTMVYLKKNDLVLDFGCATGTVTNAVAESVNHITGIDISLEMIKIARKKAQALELKNIDFRHHNV